MNSANMTPTASQKTTPEGTLSTDAPSEFLNVPNVLSDWRTRNAVQQHMNRLHSTIGWLVFASGIVWPLIAFGIYVALRTP